MNEKIEVEVQYSVKDYIRGAEFSQQGRFISILNFLVLLVLTFIGYFAVYWFFIRKDEGGFGLADALMLALGLLIIIPLVYFLNNFNPFIKNYVAKQYESSPVLKEKQIISFDEEGIKSKSVSQSGEINWNAVIKTAETAEDIFFFISNKSAVFIPKRVFTEAQLVKLRELTKNKLGDKAKF